MTDAIHGNTGSPAAAAGLLGGASFVGDEVVIKPSRGWVRIDWSELSRYRELLYFFVWRDIKVRYKQSLLGAAWAILQPLMTMLVFSVLFGLLMGRNNKPTVEGIPYMVSTFCALVPWQLFATSLGRSATSLVMNQHLITKVYFPRVIAPIAPVFAALFDFVIAFAMLALLMFLYGIVPGWPVLALPLFVMLAMLTALAVALWLSALNAVYRDVGYTIPFLTQLWMYVSPVVYTTESIASRLPPWAKMVYGLNPMAGVIEGFRWALLGRSDAPGLVIIPSTVVVLLLLFGGMHYFRRMERTVADVV